jgi:ketosteroid isomerase-like protein
MEFATLIRNMAAAACRGDGRAVRECFTPDGVYHDVFYGAFQGDAIIEMIEKYFHRDACNFIWDMHTPVADGHTGYARYVFSYESKLPAAVGKRAGFEGVSVCTLQGGKIHAYHEVTNALVGLQALGFAPERLAKIATKESAAFFARPEAAHHR